MAINFGTTPIRPEDLLGLLEDKVKSSVKLSADCCFLSTAPDEFHVRFPPADLFCVVVPENMPVWQSVVSGSGDSQTGFDAVIRTTVFARLNTDQEFRGSQLIRSKAIGLVNTVTNVIGGLQFWTAPVGSDATLSYLREYMRITDGPRFVPREYKSTFWSICHTSWQMKFTALLT